MSILENRYWAHCHAAGSLVRASAQLTACYAGSQHQISFLILWRAASIRKNGPGLKPNISPWPYIATAIARTRMKACICIESLLLAKALSCATSCVGLQQLAIEYMSRRHSCTTIQARRAVSATPVKQVHDTIYCTLGLRLNHICTTLASTLGRHEHAVADRPGCAKDIPNRLNPRHDTI